MTESSHIIDIKYECFICLEEMKKKNYYCNNCKINVHKKCMKKYMEIKYKNKNVKRVVCTECRSGLINIKRIKKKKFNYRKFIIIFFKFFFMFFLCMNVFIIYNLVYWLTTNK